MSIDLLSAADDFFMNLNLQTTLALPTSRESILHFCEAVQKEFKSMASFYQRETGEYVLEGNRESGKYRWLEIQVGDPPTVLSPRTRLTSAPSPPSSTSPTSPSSRSRPWWATTSYIARRP